MTAAPPFDFFPVTVASVEQVTPSIRRIVFSGPDLARWADPGWDQRIKLVFPAADGGYAYLPTGLDWYRAYRELPQAQQCPIRTYTTREVRRLTGGHLEDGHTHVVVDMVLHEPAGPAATWAATAKPGDQLILLGPNAEFAGDAGGVDFIAPAETGCYLLGGDETAAPAIARILEDLPRHARGIAVIELPTAADCAYLPTHPGIEVRTCGRDGSRHGEKLVAEVTRAAAELCPAGTPQEVEEIDVDQELLWEVPRHAKGGAALKAASVYAWLAGEAAAVRSMRRYLVAELGWDRRAVAFMGYWCLGRAEGC